MRSAFSSSARSGSAAKSLARASRCSPLAVSVTIMAGRRAARSALSSVRVSSFTALSYLLDEDTDGAAAGQTDIPGGLVGDAELQHFGLARSDHIQRLGHHGAFDAAARNRAQERAIVIDDQAR